MKKILLVLLVAVGYCNTSVTAQTRNNHLPYSLFTNDNGRFVWDSVIQSPGMSKEELFKKVKNWVLTSIPTSNEGTTFFDTKDLIISANITVPGEKIPGSRYDFKMSARFKDGRSKVSFNSFKFTYLGQGMLYESALEDIHGIGLVSRKRLYKNFDEDFEDFLIVFFNSYSKKNEEVDDDDW